jgi:hypothetical protein
MATRAIVTDQPEVLCEICGRRLLRGERTDSFLSHGDTHAVCELCTPRAVQAGWVRVAGGAAARPQPGARRGRGQALLGLVRRRRGELQDGLLEPSAAELPSVPVRVPGAARSSFLGEGFADGAETAEHSTVPTLAFVGPGDDAADDLGAAVSGGGEAGSELAILAAIDAFNATEQPQRIAGVARSLGAPWVTVRSAARSGSAAPGMTVVAAWELCWYRWQVDIDAGGPGPTAKLVDRGTELDELPAEDLLANADVDERGRLTLAPGPVAP